MLVYPQRMRGASVVPLFVAGLATRAGAVAGTALPPLGNTSPGASAPLDAAQGHGARERYVRALADGHGHGDAGGSHGLVKDAGVHSHIENHTQAEYCEEDEHEGHTSPGIIFFFPVTAIVAAAVFSLLLAYMRVSVPQVQTGHPREGP